MARRRSRLAAVLRPTPGSVVSASRVCGTSPWKSSTSLWQQAMSARAVASEQLSGQIVESLTAGLLASHQTPLGHISFIEWLNEHGSTLGDTYANELDRHFRRRRGI